MEGNFLKNSSSHFALIFFLSKGNSNYIVESGYLKKKHLIPNRKLVI